MQNEIDSAYTQASVLQTILPDKLAEVENKVVAQFNDTYISWDGNYEGAALPAGTYYYILQLGNGVDQNGPITIVR